MADANLESYLKCSVCLDIVTEPVSLSCHHSFCKSCLTKQWAQQPIRLCPVCRRRSSKKNLEVNFAMRELCIAFREKRSASVQSGDTTSLQDSETEGESTGPTTEEPPAQWSVCPSHPQVPPLFCLDDSRPFCSFCEFSEHAPHRVVKGQEASRSLEELITSQLKTLNKDQSDCEELMQNYEDIQSFSEKQVKNCEHHIKGVFRWLHKLLEMEEKTVLTALREEQFRQKQNMAPELQKVKEKLSSLEKSIQDLKDQLETHSYRPLWENPMTQPQLKSRLLLDQAKVLGNLGFKIWTQMKRKVKYLPVILDPNTASPSLCLSEELTTVKNTRTLNKELPDVPERFRNFAMVLGSVGYSSGTHQWEVEVGDLPEWSLGVAKESVKRKQECSVSPETGFLCLSYFEGQYSNGAKTIKVKIKKSPEKIRVKLDYNKGILSFSDADNMTLIFSHTVPKGTSTEKLFPLFCVGPDSGTKTKTLKICEVHGDDAHSMDYPPLF